MLKISKQQLDIFSKALLENFEKDAVHRLSRKFPKKFLNIGEENLRKLIKNGISKAESYNISEHEDTMKFLEYMVYIGPDFDVNPETVWAARILKIRNISGSEKMERLINYEAVKPEVE